MAVVLVFTAKAFSAKLVLNDPGRMFTDAGNRTAALALERLTVTVLVGRPLKLTVHDDVAGGVRVLGTHVSPLSTGATGWLIVIVVLLAARRSRLPLPLDAYVSKSEMGVELSVVPGAI
jgi:hypothetical protein